MSKKIFITGCAKSGTTLLLRMCYAFKDTEILYRKGFDGHELPFDDFINHKSLNQFVIGKRHPPALLSNVLVPEFEAQQKSVIDNDVAIINVVRDGRDVVLSDGNYVKPRRWIETVKQRSPEVFGNLINLEVRYEDLVRNPAKIQKQMEEAFGLESVHSFSDYPEYVEDWVFEWNVSVLARAGYFEIGELATFRKINSRLQGHPTTHEKLEGIRVASGSLGQGLSVAIGAALSKKLNKDNKLIYSLHGDGELQEGQIWEAVMYAAANKVDNIIATIDYNKKQIDGEIDDVLPLGDLKAKFEAFDWIVLEEKNGNDLESISSILKRAKELTNNNKPIVILLHTEMGNGVDFMMGTHKWHGSAPNDEQLEIALSQNTETLGDY